MQNQRHHGSPSTSARPQFDPTRFDAAAWVALAKAAGRYITFTTKHHDGFSMWDSSGERLGHRDPHAVPRRRARSWPTECQRRACKLFVYYSQLDWHHPDYFPRGGTGRWTGRARQRATSAATSTTWTRSSASCSPATAPLAGVWFDGWWDQRRPTGGCGRTYRMIHDLQPAALVGSNHTGRSRARTSRCSSKDLPGTQTRAGFDSALGSLPMEMCDTINDSWGFRLTDRHKSTKQLVHVLVEAAGHDANFLLNVGPMPTGEIQPEFASRLADGAVAADPRRDDLRDARRPLPPPPWGVTTHKGDRVIVHVLDWQDPVLSVARPPKAVKKASLLATGAPVQFTILEKDALLLRLDPKALDPLDTIVVLELGGGKGGICRPGLARRQRRAASLASVFGRTCRVERMQALTRSGGRVKGRILSPRELQEACTVVLALLVASCGGTGDSPSSPTTPTPTAVARPLWSEVAPLREAAASSHKLVGAAVFSSGLASDTVYAGAAARHFNDLTAEWEMKWDPIEKTRGVFDFSGGDAIVGFAEAHGMQVKGHALVWHQAAPAWLESLSPPELRIAFEDHIRAVAGHYRGRRAGLGRRQRGDRRHAASGCAARSSRAGWAPDYVAEAFRLARQADPEAQLIYNDYSAEGMGRQVRRRLRPGQRSQAAWRADRGRRPADAHLGRGLPPLADVAAQPAPARRSRAEGQHQRDGRPRCATSRGDCRGEAAARSERSTTTSSRVCVAEPRCDAVTFWGFTDAHTWIDGFFGPDDPLLFDERYRAKPAFYGVQDAYLGR